MSTSSDQQLFEDMLEYLDPKHTSTMGRFKLHDQLIEQLRQRVDSEK